MVIGLAKCRLRNIIFLLPAIVQKTYSFNVLTFDLRTLTFAYDPLSPSYNVSVEANANQIPNGASYNLMLPPNESDPCLCSRPHVNMDENFQRVDLIQGPIALLVCVSGCLPKTKIRVGLWMQQFITPKLQSLIVYDNTPSQEPSGLPNYEMLLKEPFGMAMSMMFLPDHYNEDFFRKLFVKQTNSASRFLDKNNENWSLFINISNQSTSGGGLPPYDVQPGPTTGSTYNDNLEWVRYVIFVLLVATPCFRTGYLFYAGGGRIWFRRNDRGRIIGLQYIPPFPFWMINGGGVQRDQPMHHRLTEEEFDNLPEITYHPVENPSADTLDSISVSTPTTGSTQNQNHSGELNHDVESGSKTCHEVFEGSTPAQSEPMEETHAAGTPSSEETRLDPAILPNGTTTSCTVCSICIDDFEPGERLVLLPLCQHAFHKSCLKPWLTERHGCCPLCKTAVLERSESGSEGHSADSDL